MILVLIVVIVIGLCVAMVMAPPKAVCPPPTPPPVVVDSLGSGDTTPMGVPTALIRAIYSVVEPPTCVEDPNRPQAKGIPESADVQHILTQVTRRINDSASSFRVAHGAVIHSVMYTDTEGIGTYYITAMLHEATTSISIRVSIKARMASATDAPRILNVSFDPQSADADPTDPTGVGRVPYADAKPLRH